MPDPSKPLLPVYHQNFNAHVGPVLSALDGPPEGPQRFHFDVKDHHLNADGFVHGGMMMALADITLGVTTAATTNRFGATISLACDFTAAAAAGDRIEAEGRILRLTRELAFLEGRLWTDGKTLLTTTGVWKIFPPGDTPAPSPTSFGTLADPGPTPSPPDPPQGYQALDLGDPFEVHMGPFFRLPGEWDGSTLSDAMRLDARHVNARGVCHGGTLLTLADAVAGGLANRVAGKPAVTLSMQGNFLRPCVQGDWVIAKASLTHKTRSIVFVDIALEVEGETVFSASSLWKVLGA